MMPTRRCAVGWVERSETHHCARIPCDWTDKQAVFAEG